MVALPDGFEYHEMEVASCKSLTTSGAISMSHTDSHSSLATVEHTPAGVQ